MSAHDEYFALVDLYALGRLADPELGELEQHLASGCELCRGRLLEAEETTASLAATLAPIEPSQRARRALLDSVRTTAVAATPARNARSTSRTSWLMPLALAAAVVVTVSLARQVRELEQRLDSERGARAALGAEVASLRDAVANEQRARAALASEIATTRNALDTLTAPGTLPVVLAGQATAPGAAAKAFVDRVNGRVSLYVYDLPLPAPGRTYQLWVIVEGAPKSLGVFDVSGKGPTRYEASELPPLTGKITIAVTEEPSGGVPQPTGPMVLVGS